MESVVLIFPHQLFAAHPALTPGCTVVLVEEALLFTQLPFHRIKLAYHRASMRAFAEQLRQAGHTVRYVESHVPEADIRVLLPQLHEAGVRLVRYCDPVDDWLSRRLAKGCSALGITRLQLDSPMFLNSEAELRQYFAGRKRMFQTDFYVAQRKARGILLDASGSPVGGKWTFDVDNRARYPKGKLPPFVQRPDGDGHWQAACAMVEAHYPRNPGHLSSQPPYPYTHAGARAWLQAFLHTRFQEFGLYEDAIVAQEVILHHSVLTPMLNIGLLTPGEVIQAAIAHAEQHPVPINSLEGFVRQVMGWREFMRAAYVLQGRAARTRNYWGFTRPIPASYWTGQTGIGPVDTVIRKVLATGYCHHIERLMVLGNWMLLQEFDPDEVYRWFMALFIDAYDWVMVPNVYGMSQFADGGMITTKPYISGSNYLIKMADFAKGPWQMAWDGLFWRFMDRQRAFFSSNPRLGMLLKTLDNMDTVKRTALMRAAEAAMG